MPIELSSDEVSVSAFPKISVFGVGGAGINAVNNMILSQLDGIKFVAANTDCQSLTNSLASTKIQLGAKCTKGLGAGSKPEIGRQAAEEACDVIKRELAGIDMVFIATGMGGGTGTGASPVIAKMAKDMGILTIVIAIKPFMLEGKRRVETANRGIAELENIADTLIVIENQKLMELNNVSMFDNYAIADGILRQAIYCVVNILLKQGFINRDFADIKTVLSSAGRAVIGYGEDVDPLAATEFAIHNQVLENNSIYGAKNILVNICGNRNIKPIDVENIINKIRNEAKINEDDEPNVIFGIAFDEDIGNNIRVSVIAAGVENIQETNNISTQENNTYETNSLYTECKNNKTKLDKYSDNDKDESEKIEAPVFVKPLDEDSLVNDESFNLKIEDIQETEENVIPFKNTFFSNSMKNKTKKTIHSQNNTIEEENKNSQAGLFDNNQKQKGRSFLLKIMNCVSSIPDIGNNKNLCDDNEDCENDEDIYNTPTVKRKIG